MIHAVPLQSLVTLKHALLPSPMFLQHHGLLPEPNPPGADEKLHPASEIAQQDLSQISPFFWDDCHQVFL